MSRPCSENLHDITELPGQSLPLDTLEIIRFRYDWAARHIEGRRALEIGCGSGIGLGYFAQTAAHFVGGDYSEENLRICARIPGMAGKVVRFDAHALPFADESFDVVVALAMVYYLRMETLLAETARVLAPGGSFVFCTSNKDVAGFVQPPHTVAYYSVPDLARLIRAAGLTPEFHGAFPSAGGYVALSRARGLAKNAAKALITSLPGGRRFWERMRHSAEGAHAMLPTDIRDIPASLEQMHLLNPDSIDRIHRVIYVTARKS